MYSFRLHFDRKNYGYVAAHYKEQMRNGRGGQAGFQTKLLCHCNSCICEFDKRQRDTKPQFVVNEKNNA